MGLMGLDAEGWEEVIQQWIIHLCVELRLPRRSSEFMAAAAFNHAYDTAHMEGARGDVLLNRTYDDGRRELREFVEAIRR
jgi:hypothetical protein